MKNIIFLVAAFVVLTATTSCKKSYTCRCTNVSPANPNDSIPVGPGPADTSFTVEAYGTKGAVSQCAQQTLNGTVLCSYEGN